MGKIPQVIKNKIVAEANWRSTNGHGGVDDITRDNFIQAAEFGYSLASKATPDQRVVFEVIDTVKAQYPASVFPDNGTSPDAKAGIMARLICDNIKREMEIMFNKEPDVQASVASKADSSTEADQQIIATHFRKRRK